MNHQRHFDMEVISKEIVTYILVSGYITEDNSLPALFEYRPPVVIDTKNVEMVNSCGLRDWIDWHQKIKGSIYWVRCSPAIISLANEVSTILDSGTLINFHIPYFCEICKASKNILVSPHEAQKKHFDAPICDGCRNPLEPDEPLAYYLSFMANVKVGDLPADIATSIEKLMARHP